MAGKTIEQTRITTLDELRAKAEERYSAVPYEHPNGYGTMEVARLKRVERKIIRDATFIYGNNGEIVRIDDELSNRMAVAYGLVSPRIADTPEKAIEELKQWPDDFIDPIATKVWEISNDFRTTTNGKGEPDAAPFTKRSLSATASAPSSAGTSTT